jgi:hypothetical protein
MAPQRRWTAEELERLSPDERAALLNERVVTDLDGADPGLVEWARAKGVELLAARGADQPG